MKRRDDHTLTDFEDKSRDELWIDPEFDSLYKENMKLRTELATLMEEFEHIVRFVIPSTQTTFLIKVGALRVELLRRQLAVMKLRRKIAMIREAAEHGESVRSDTMEYRLDHEFKEWDERLIRENKQIEDAKARFSSLVVSEDEDEIRNVYCLLSRKMNPEINPEQGEEAKSFWSNIRSAYEWKDLFHLKALLMMTDDYPESYDMPTNIGGMRTDRDRLKKTIEETVQKIENIKSHPAFAWRKILDDPTVLEREQSKLRDEINRMRTQEFVLNELLNSLEMKRVGQ